MKFYGIRELSNSTKKVIESLSFGSPVVITDKGKPKAILLKIDEDNFEMILDSINRYSALKNLEEIQNESLKNILMMLTKKKSIRKLIELEKK